MNYDRTSISCNAHLNLGWIYYAAGEYDTAVQEYRKAQLIRENDAIILNNLGNAYAGMGELDQALEQYEKAIELSREKARPYTWEIAIFHANLGQAYLQNNQLGEAAQSYKRAIEHTPDEKSQSHKSYYCFLLGQIHWASEQFDEAIKAYSQAVSLAPGVPQFYNELARAYLDLEKYSGAKWACNQTLMIDGGNRRALQLKVDALRGLKQDHEAQEAERLLACIDEQHLPPNSSMTERSSSLYQGARSIVQRLVESLGAGKFFDRTRIE